MPTNGYDPSSQTVLSPRQSAYPMMNGHVFSSRSPALRAALATPSAVRPDGLWDHRGSNPDTAVVLRDASGEGERSATRRWQDKAAMAGGSAASPQPAPVTEVARSGQSDTVVD